MDPNHPTTEVRHVIIDDDGITVSTGEDHEPTTEVRHVIIDDEYRRLLDREVIARIICNAHWNLEYNQFGPIVKNRFLNAADAVTAYIEEVLYDRH